MILLIPDFQIYLWQSNKKNAVLSIPFFGCPFMVDEKIHYECVHAGEKRVYTYF